jgi:hypothetical protein
MISPSPKKSLELLISTTDCEVVNTGQLCDSRRVPRSRGMLPQRILNFKVQNGHFLHLQSDIWFCFWLKYLYGRFIYN